MKYFILAILLILPGCGKNDAGLAKSMSITKDQRAAIENRIMPFRVVAVAGATESISFTMRVELACFLGV